MIVIILSWIFILSICYLFGFGIIKKFQPNSTISETIIVGIIGVTTVANAISFLFPISNSLLIVLIINCFANVLMFRNEIQLQLKNYTHLFNTKNIIILLLSTIVFSAYSSGYSTINDDGLYYNQTIMWLREYGLVHGISNLHLSLGLSSSWHVFQAIFTFSNNINLNDINGLLMLVFTLFMIEQKHKNSTNYQTYFQYILVLLISIPFYSAPNPDFAIIIFTTIAIIQLITSVNHEKYAFIIILSAFCITIKISAIALLLIGFYSLFILIKSTSIKANKYVILITITITIIYISKNIYQTAYPLYPYKIMGANFDWKTPEPIINYFTNGVKTWSYSNTLKPSEIEQIKDITPFELLKNLLARKGTKGLINQLIIGFSVIGIILFIILWLKKKLNNNTIALHISMALSMAIWFIFAPQYRFALPMFIFYLAFIAHLIYAQFVQSFIKINEYYLQLFVLIVLLIPLITGLNIKANESSNKVGQFNQITAKQTLIPMPQYHFNLIDTIVVNGTSFYHINGNTYCWNAPLPCMSEAYQKIIYDNFKYKISLRENTLNEGFKFIDYKQTIK